MAAALSAYENGVKDILLLERDQYLGGILNQCVHTGFGIEYFKEMSAETGIPYQNLINLYLRECVTSQRKLSFQ